MASPVIAVANCKGGSGKTTTAVNLSAELAASGRRVLLIDLDPQGHSGFGFGVSAKPGEMTAHQLFRPEGIDIDEMIRPTGASGVDIIPADRGFRIHSVADDPRPFARAVRGLRADYDAVVIDTPPAADLLLLSALSAARFALIPTQLHHLAHDGVMQFSRLFFAVAMGLNPELAAFAIVPVQVDMRTHLQQFVLAQLMAEFGPRRIFRGIRVDIALAEAFGGGRPVRQHRPNARGAADYQLLAEHVVQGWAM